METQETSRADPSNPVLLRSEVEVGDLELSLPVSDSLLARSSAQMTSVSVPWVSGLGDFGPVPIFYTYDKPSVNVP